MNQRKKKKRITHPMRTLRCKNQTPSFPKRGAEAGLVRPVCATHRKRRAEGVSRLGSWRVERGKYFESAEAASVGAAGSAKETRSSTRVHPGKHLSICCKD